MKPLSRTGEGPVAPAGRYARPPRSLRAFTMVEIALCIAIVAFALVAIIGVLPTGLKVQRDNREDTIISQEGSFWLEALRGGALGLDYLTNHIDRILIDTYTKKGQQAVRHQSNTYFYYRSGTDAQGFENGRDIIGLLSVPRYLQIGDLIVQSTNTTAYVRALTGSAADKTPGNDFAFLYRLRSEISPYEALTGFNTDFNQPGLTHADRVLRTNELARAGALRANLYELRLTIDWPVYLRRGQLEVGGNRKIFRTLVGGGISTTNVKYLHGRDLFFLKPSEFARPVVSNP